MLETLDQADRSATLWLNSLDSPFTDTVWITFSNKIVWIPLYVLLLYFLWRGLGWKKLLFVLGAIILTFACGELISNIVKHSVERLRPCHDSGMTSLGLNILEGKGGRFGFYSAHAANSFGLAICSWYCLKKLDPGRKYAWFGILAFIWASGVSISRAFVGKHYLGDIMVGILAGLALGYIISRLAVAASRKWAA